MGAENVFEGLTGTIGELRPTVYIVTYSMQYKLACFSTYKELLEFSNMS